MPRVKSCHVRYLDNSTSFGRRPFTAAARVPTSHERWMDNVAGTWWKYVKIGCQLVDPPFLWRQWYHSPITFHHISKLHSLHTLWGTENWFHHVSPCLTAFSYVSLTCVNYLPAKIIKDHWRALKIVEALKIHRDGNAGHAPLPSVLWMKATSAVLAPKPRRLKQRGVKVWGSGRWGIRILPLVAKTPQRWNATYATYVTYVTHVTYVTYPKIHRNRME